MTNTRYKDDRHHCDREVTEKKQLKGTGIDFGSQSEGTIRHRRCGLRAGTPAAVAVRV